MAGNRNRGINPLKTDKIVIYISKYLKNDNAITFIDIGAHRGDFFNQILNHYSIKRTVLIEPIAHLANYLAENFSNDNVAIYNNAISDKNNESIEFQINEFEETSSILQFKSQMSELSNVNTKPARKEKVIMRTLDSITEELQLQTIDLIKIDVQGVEHLVIAGATDTLSNTRFVWVELSFKPLYIGSSVFQDIYLLLQDLGFLLLELSPGHRSSHEELLQSDALFVNSKFR
jgi:FkbM family methyltransferase